MNREVSYVFEVYRDGALFGELLAIDSPEIKMVSNGELKMALSGTFAKNDQVDLLTDTIRPRMILNGESYPLGEFYVATMPILYENGVDRVRIEAYDGNLILKQRSLENSLSVPKTARYTDVVQELLIDSGITRLLVEESPAVLLSEREDWPVGTSYLSIINELLAEINYNSLWFDMEGNARVSAYKAPTVENAAFTYDSGEASIIMSDCMISEDAYNAYNVFIAVVSSPDYDEPIQAVSVNEDPSSPISTIRRGRRIVAPVIKLNNIASEDALQKYVDRIRYESMASGETVTFETANNPAHQVFDAVLLNHERIKGVYEETEWSMSLSYNGRMTHKAKKAFFSDFIREGSQDMTTLANLEIGDLVSGDDATIYGVPIVWRVVDKNHEGYPANSVTLIADKVVALVPFDAAEPTNPDANRANGGNGRWSKSNIRQWLNSSAGPGKWYSSMHEYDQAPDSESVVDGTLYASWSGFLYGFSDKMRAEIPLTEVKTALCDADGVGLRDVTYDWVFLPSLNEVGISEDLFGFPEGTSFPVFYDDDSRISYQMPEAWEIAPGNKTDDPSWSTDWRLRSPYPSSSNGVMHITYKGGRNATRAYESRVGIRPVINLSGNVKVAKNADSIGVYTFVL